MPSPPRGGDWEGGETTHFAIHTPLWLRAVCLLVLPAGFRPRPPRLTGTKMPRGPASSLGMPWTENMEGFMVYPLRIAVVLWVGLAASLASAQVSDSSFRDAEAALTPAERAGREIWFNATAGNARFFTYVFQQRVGVAIDWFRILNAAGREDRFKLWGLMNDPSCCKPGDPHCPARSAEETFGMDWCPGDDTLLPFVGKTGWRDPACDFRDVPVAAGDPHGPSDQRESPCALAFGASTGALGIRKFPNPRFDKAAWNKLTGGQPASWQAYNQKLSGDPTHSDYRVSRLMDGSIEPPFLIGMACGACHIAFDPLHPPKDPAHPSWGNLSGTVGNQYALFSQILGSGMSPDSLEWQVFGYARPGAVDTSAIPTDQVNNPGTMNAIINLSQRPTFTEEVNKWRKVNACPATANAPSCWCEPGKSGKCWEKGTRAEPVNHILKGGEDSIGPLEAVQRVYFNIGSCSEQAWMNHLTDLRQVDPAMRGFGQTPFDIGQARRDCAAFRAVEDRLGEVFAFLASARPSDLYQARGLKDRKALSAQLDKEFGKGAVARGQVVFAQMCARCHSSQEGPFEGRDFLEEAAPGLRKDWLGNDQLVLASEIGTNRARALHSNHVKGHVWEEYGSETLRAKPADPTLVEPADGGRGYYRNISLLSVWAHAPFMHNNAIGPELCGDPADLASSLYRSPYVDTEGRPLSNPPPCWKFDPSVEGRLALYKASMAELLNPAKRIPKVTMLDRDLILPIGPKIWDDEKETMPVGVTVKFQKGTPTARIGNFRHKELIGDLVWSRTRPGPLKAKYAQRYGPQKGDAAVARIQEAATRLFKDPKAALAIASDLGDLYSNNMDMIENAGHRFGEDLPDADKAALTAFLATL